MVNYCSNITVKKRAKQFTLYCVMGLFLSLYSCNAIFEKDISDETVDLIIPSNGDTLSTNQIHVKWNEMKGADFYNLQIVTPSFESISSFIIDSNVTEENSYQILSPGDYELRIRAENGAYQSLYTDPVAIVIDSVSDLSAQFVSLISPSDEIFSDGATNITVSWQNLFAADRYEYVLKTGSSFNDGSIIDQVFDITSLEHIISADNFAVEGTYFWGIKGVNDESSSTYSVRRIYIDLTRPNSPNALSPADLFTVDAGDEVTLKWTTGIDPGTINSPVSSTVEIAPTDTFEDITQITGITSDSANYTFPLAGNYWWRVKSEDAVGNVSEFYSIARQIIVE